LEADIKKRKRKSSKRKIKEKCKGSKRDTETFYKEMVAIRSIKNRRYNADMSNKKETVQNKKVY